MATGQKVLHSGYLGIVRKDRIDQRYFVLYDDILDFYLTADDFSNGEKKGRLALADVEELGVLDDGFVLTLGRGRTLTVRCEVEHLNTWLEKIKLLMDADEEDDENDAAKDDKRDDRALRNAEESEVEVEVHFDGDLLIEEQGRREKRYLWLTGSHLECFKDRASAEHEVPIDSLDITIIAQADRTATGFTVSRKDKKRQLVIICDAPTSREWILEIRKAIGAGREEPAVNKSGAKSEELALDIRKEEVGKVQGIEEQEAEVIFDEKLEIEINGKVMWKHAWLTTVTFDYTETDEADEDAIESFLITQISTVLKTTNGFTVCHDDGRKIVIRCTSSTSETWTNHFQNLLASKKPIGANSAEVKDIGTKASTPILASTDDKGKGADASEWAGVKTPAVLSQSAESPRRVNEDQTRTVTTPVWSKQAQGATPSPSSKNVAPPGYPGAKHADEANKEIVAAPNEVQSTPMSYSTQPDPSVICQGSLGILQRGQEESRYFVLYPDAFKYWLDQTSYSRSDEPRGHVLNDQIVDILPTSTGFALSFDGGNQIVLICETQRQLWLAEWRNILANRPRSIPASNEAMSATIPQEDTGMFRNDKPQPNEVASIITRSPLNPGAMVNVSKDVLYEGSLTLVRKVKQEKRYFVLFKDRLDYFAAASDLRSGKTPRGRVWYRDIDSVNLEGYRFTLALAGALSGSSSMVLFAEPQDLQLWHAAWTETGVTWRGSPTMESKNASRSVSPSPARSNLQKISPSLLQEPLIHGAIIEGQFQLSRGKVAGAATTLRHFVLFPDRLDYFSDAATARRGRALESFPTKDIQWIDVVDGGFELTVAHRAYKLRELQGILPQWIDALLRVFGERENDYIRRS